ERLAGAAIAIDRLRRLDRLRVRDVEESLQERIDPAGALEVGSRDLDGAGLARSHERPDRGDPLAREIGHPITLGPLNGPRSGSGAFRSASSRPIDGRTASSRRAWAPLST